MQNMYPKVGLVEETKGHKETYWILLNNTGKGREGKEVEGDYIDLSTVYVQKSHWTMDT
jgi:hypothetical protein